MHVCVLSAFSFAALISVLFRLCARKIQMIRLELNDYLCIAGLVCTRPFSAGGMLIESLDVHLRIDIFHDTFHYVSEFRPRRSQYELGRQGAADWTAAMGYLRNAYPGLSSDAVCSNLSDAIFSQSLLSGPRLQSGLFYGRGPSLFLDLPASRIHLGPVYRWVLREPKVSRHVHWSVQPLVGRHDCRAPNASVVGSPNAEEAEASHYRHVLHGSGVSNK